MSTRAPESGLWDILRGALTTRALALVADLRVAAALDAGPRPVEDLAREVGADPDTLRRLLRALASDGVFVEEEPGIFRNNEASEVLHRGDGWNDFAHLFGGSWLRAVGELDATSRQPAFQRLYGSEFWAWLAEHPDEWAAFDRAMLEGWERRAERLAALDWRGDEVVVDVGGGNGSLLVELLRRQPGLRGIVFDLPETNRDEAALGDRTEFVKVTSSSVSRSAMCTCLRRSSTTGTTSGRQRSCGRFVPPRRATHGCSSSTPSSRPGTSRTARNGSTS